MWAALVCVYGAIKGVRDVIKKKAMEKSTAIEVLFFYTLISFLLVTPSAKTAVSVDYSYMWLIAIKSLVIFVAWICGFNAIKQLPVGFYGIMDMSRVIISTALGVIVLGESLTTNKIVGMALVIAGLLLVNLGNKGKNSEKTKPVYIALVMVSCFGNATSAMFDKILMQHMSSGQLQFWYMLFLVIFYLGYILITRTRISIKNALKNHWIWILSVLFVIGDRALFIANSSPDSTLVAMTLIKQCSVLVTIICGRLVFKEKRTLYKLCCAAVVIAGIVIAVV